jgi:hypothetical protein
MQKSLFQKIAAMNQQGVTKHYEEFVAEEETTHRYSENGKFLPLAVWGAQGPSSILSRGRKLAPSGQLAQAVIDFSAPRAKCEGEDSTLLARLLVCFAR